MVARFVLWVLVSVAGSIVSQGAIAQGNDREQAVNAFEAGRAAMQRQEWSAALSQFERAGAHPDVAPAARLHLGLVREQMGQADQAAVDYLAVLEMKGSSGYLEAVVYDRLAALAQARVRDGDIAGAEALLKPAHRSARIDVLELYSHVLISQKKWKDAQNVVARLQKQDPYGLDAWAFLYQSHKGRADAAMADPATAAEGKKLMARVEATEEERQAIPFFLDDLRVEQEQDTHVVRATMLGNGAPAGSWCIIEFSLDMGANYWRAPVFVTVPAREQKVEIKALPATTSTFPNPPRSSEPVYSVSYSLPYCEVKGAAAQTPPNTTSVRLNRCPEDSYEANELVEDREPLGSLADEYKPSDEEYSYPAGGIELFGKPITRLTARERSGELTIFYFGLPGEHADYVDRFKRAYKHKRPSCKSSSYCQTTLDDTTTRDELFMASLERTGPSRLRPEGTYLRCEYAYR